jgi:hypothetical protein
MSKTLRQFRRIEASELRFDDAIGVELERLARRHASLLDDIAESGAPWNADVYAEEEALRPYVALHGEVLAARRANDSARGSEVLTIARLALWASETASWYADCDCPSCQGDHARFDELVSSSDAVVVSFTGHGGPTEATVWFEKPPPRGLEEAAVARAREVVNGRGVLHVRRDRFGRESESSVSSPRKPSRTSR